MKKFIRFTTLLLSATGLMICFHNCSGIGSAVSPSSTTASALPGGGTPPPWPIAGGGGTLPAIGQANVMAVSVGCGYTNEPCVTVTICAPGTNNCQTIPNVLIDTGSYGLRLFNQYAPSFNSNTLTNLMTLPMEADPGNASNVLTECVSYADGSSDWGPVATADVTLGTEVASSVPIQIINAGFATMPSECQNPDSSPFSTGFNGILGVGLFGDDCGPGCAPGQPNAADNGIYFSCPSNGSGSCTGVAVAEINQTTNPVALLSTDNNGVILELPSVPISFGLNDGAMSLNGYLVLGIGTEANNVPSGTTTFPADENGNFTTIFSGTTSNSSFIDSGSNALYFTGPSSLPTCADDSSFYCPTSEMSFTATQQGAGGTGSETVTFSIGNTDDDFSTSNPNYIFADLGGTMSSDFDWGLPFFFGRNVYVGIDGTTSSLGTGPLWAY